MKYKKGEGRSGGSGEMLGLLPSKFQAGGTISKIEPGETSQNSRHGGVAKPKKGPGQLDSSVLTLGVGDLGSDTKDLIQRKKNARQRKGKKETTFVASTSDAHVLVQISRTG